jgi:hypothetical protein
LSVFCTVFCFAWFELIASVLFQSDASSNILNEILKGIFFLLSGYVSRRLHNWQEKTPSQLPQVSLCKEAKGGIFFNLLCLTNSAQGLLIRIYFNQYTAFLLNRDPDLSRNPDL